MNKWNHATCRIIDIYTDRAAVQISERLTEYLRQKMNYRENRR